MTTCQNAANEFLRQFWLAIYPPPHEAQIISASNSAQKAAKATKMIGYLEKTHAKVAALADIAQKEGVDPSRVQVVSSQQDNEVARSCSNSSVGIETGSRRS